MRVEQKPESIGSTQESPRSHCISTLRLVLKGREGEPDEGDLQEKKLHEQKEGKRQRSRGKKRQR